MSTTFEFTKYGPHTLSVQTDRYTFGAGLVVDLIDETDEPYARVSINWARTKKGVMPKAIDGTVGRSSNA